MGRRVDARKRVPGGFFVWIEMQPISDEQIEIIKATYAESGNIRASSRAAKVSVATAKKYVDSTDGLEQIRTEKRVDIIAKIAEVQIKLLDAIVDADGLKKASLTEKSVSFGIVTDKYQLMIGEATERHEHRDTTDARDTIARRIDELAERRRARQADSQPLREASG